MSEPDAASMQSDLEALEALQADAPDLERIEGLLDRFNVYEVIGFVGQEIMHSRFLAFLLDPKQSHGLGDFFLRGFLRKISESTSEVSLPQALGNADDGSLGQTTVQTEVYTDDGRIDILLLNEAGKWAMIVENKVWSAEHSDQLGRYHRFVKKNHHDWQVFGVYLTPYGAAPERSEDKGMYQPLSYGVICRVLDSVIEHRGSILNPDVRMAVEHYVQMARRQIVGDPEVVALCRDMYRKHKKAFDLIYKHRPDPKAETHRFLTGLINSTEGLIHKSSSKYDYIWFRPREWEEIPALNANYSVNGILRFAFLNDRPDRLALVLEISRGDREIRRRLHEMGQKDRALFNDLGDPEIGEKQRLYRRTFLTREHYETASDTERAQELRRQWDEFLDKDLLRIVTTLKKEEWILEPAEPGEERSSEGSRFVWGDGDIVITKRPEDED